MVHHDIVKGSVQQGSKKFTGEPSHLPKQEPILSHVSKILRQAEGAKVVEGGCIGDDAWSGSINSCVELKKRLGIFSSSIVKTDKKYCPVESIRSVLLARYCT